MIKAFADPTSKVYIMVVCQEWDSRGWKNRIIDKNYNPEQSKVLCRREVLLSDSRKKALEISQGHQSRE